MKLHYSQTDIRHFDCVARFTTLWNYTTLKRHSRYTGSRPVLLPYEITLLSNSRSLNVILILFYYLMKLHYSQTQLFDRYCKIVFYYLMKLHYSQTLSISFLSVLLFYYLMKLHYSQTDVQEAERTATFYYLMKLHYSQTCLFYQAQCKEFYYLMKLHYSQTFVLCSQFVFRFTTLWNYTTLKRRSRQNRRSVSFTTLWNYTTLKPDWRIHPAD